MRVKEMSVTPLMTAPEQQQTVFNALTSITPLLSNLTTLHTVPTRERVYPLPNTLCDVLSKFTRLKKLYCPYPAEGASLACFTSLTHLKIADCYDFHDLNPGDPSEELDVAHLMCSLKYMPELEELVIQEVSIFFKNSL